MTWPNRITYTRLLLVPLFAIAAMRVAINPAYRYVALGLFAAMAVSDLLDGYIARKFNLTSLEGKFIDPVADKVLMVTACVFLALPIWGMAGGAPALAPEVAVIIVARDVMICLWVTAAYIAGTRMIYEPSGLGKFTTFVQMLMLGTVLAGTIWQGPIRKAGAGLSYAAAIFTIASGVHYLYKYAMKMGNSHGVQAKAPAGEARNGNKPG